MPKLTKLVHSVQSLVTRLDGSNDLIVHQNVNQFYYMQKLEELRILIELLQEAKEGTESTIARIDTCSKAVFFCWRRDVRWLSAHERCIQGSKLSS